MKRGFLMLESLVSLTLALFFVTSVSIQVMALKNHHLRLENVTKSFDQFKKNSSFQTETTITPYSETTNKVTAVFFNRTFEWLEQH